MDALAHIDVKEILGNPKGSRLIYHVGLLSADRGEVSKKTAAQSAVDKQADAAWALYLKGVVTLVQRRIAPELYEYIAIRL